MAEKVKYKSRYDSSSSTSRPSSKRREAESFMCAPSPRPPLLRVVTTEQWRNQNIRVNKQEKNYEYLQDSSKCRYLMITHHDNMNSSR